MTDFNATDYRVKLKAFDTKVSQALGIGVYMQQATDINIGVAHEEVTLKHTEKLTIQQARLLHNQLGKLLKHYDNNAGII